MTTFSDTRCNTTQFKVRPGLLAQRFLPRKSFRGKRVSTTFSLPQDMIQALEELATSLGYTRSYVAEDLLEFGLRARARADARAAAEVDSSEDDIDVPLKRDDEPSEQ